jgi:hypothetical protein
MKRHASITFADVQRHGDARRVPEELKPFLIEVARLIANDILREEAARTSRRGLPRET